jgi:segregation and condensation protein B
LAKKKLTPPETPAPPPPVAEPAPAPVVEAPPAAEEPAPKKRRGKKETPAEATPAAPSEPELVMTAAELTGPAAPAEPEGAEPPMDESAAIRTFEALVFASEEPLPPAAVRKIVPGATPARVRRWAEALQKEYDELGRAFQLKEIAGGWQILTRPEHAEAVGKMLKVKSEGKLSAAALETLAIVAYRQPINRADLEAIRGVGSGPLLRALMEKGLVKVTGKEETLGRPVLYGTTEKFLEMLGLASVKDLPKPEELKG